MVCAVSVTGLGGLYEVYGYITEAVLLYMTTAQSFIGGA